MSGPRPRVLIAHADGESDRAAELAGMLDRAGYDVVHQGTLFVGESLAEEASRALAQGNPVVICATVMAVGTGWVHRIWHAARHHPHCLVLPVRMDRNAYLEMLDWGASVAEYWQDPALAVTRLLVTLAERYPARNGGGGSRPDHRAAEERYRSLMLANYDIYDWSGLPQRDPRLTSSKLELRRLYVALRVFVESSADIGLDPAQFEVLEYVRAEQRGMWAFQRGRGAEAWPREPPRVPIGDRMAASRRIVVLGDPGSGKSTLLKWIATAYLLRLRRDPDWQDLPDVRTLPDLDLLPIMVRCRELAHDYLSQTFDSVLEQTLHKLVLGREVREPLRDLLLSRLDSGQALLLVDGLDEINDPQARAAFCELIERTHAAYPAALMIVTSRIVGYREMGRRIGRGFEHVRVADLDRGDREELARRWCDLTEPPSRAESAAAGLIQDIHSTDRIERLTGNPLLLTTMAMVRRYLGRLPNRRGDLYAEAVQVLLNWRTDVGEPLNHNEALPQLEYIAYTMCRDSVQQLRLDELVDCCARMRAEFPNIHALGRHDPEAFIRLVEHRTGLLNEAGYVRHQGQLVGVFEFRHLTFQEYLAGLAIARGHFPGHVAGTSVAAAVGPLTTPVWSTAPENEPSRLVVPESWREPIRLCATACNSSHVDAVLSAVLTPSEEDDAEAAARPRAVLAALCLADEPDASAHLVDRTIERLIDGIDDRDGDNMRWLDKDERREPRSELDEAAIELANSRWRERLEATLVQRYRTLPPIDRIPVGAVLAQVLASEWRDGGSTKAWTDELCRCLESDDDTLALKGALCVGATVNNVDLTAEYRCVEMAGRLIKLCGRPAPSAGAGAWALTRIAYHYDPLRPTMHGPQGFHTSSTCWYLSSRDMTEISHWLSGDADLDAGVLFCLYGVARQEHIIAARSLARRTIEHSDGRLRAASAHALGGLDDHQSVPVLVRLLHSDPDPRVRASAARALGWMGSLEPLPDLISARNDGNSEVRQAIAIALGDLSTERAVLPLEVLLADTEPSVRRHAVALVGERSAAPILRPHTNDADPRVRQAAALAAGRLRDEAARPALRAAVEDRDARVREAAIIALAELGITGDKATIDRVAARLTDSSADVRARAAIALGPLAMGRFLPDLTERLADQDSWVCARALQALAVLVGEHIAVNEVIAQLQSDNCAVSTAAMEVLVAQSWEGLPEQLIELCRHKPTGSRLLGAAGVYAWFDRCELARGPRDQLVELMRHHLAGSARSLRTAATVGLGLLGEPVSAEQLAAVRPDCDWDTESSLHLAIGQLIGVENTRVLEWLGTHNSPMVTYQMATWLGTLGKREHLPLLLRLASSHHVDPSALSVRRLMRFHDAEDAVRLMISGLDHTYWRMRFHAAHALYDCPGRVITDVLLAHSADKCLAVRRAVLRSLGGREPELVLPVLLEGLEDQDARTRQAAAAALGRTRQGSAMAVRFAAMLGAAEPEARSIGLFALPLEHQPELCDRVVPYLDDANEEVREAALTALKRVGHPAAMSRLRANLRASEERLRADVLWDLKLDRDGIDQCLLGQDFSSDYPLRDPLWPVTLGTVRLAAFRLMLHPEEVKRRYETMAHDFGLPCTWMPAG